MSKEDLLNALEQQGNQELTLFKHEAQERFTALRHEYASRLRLARRDQRAQLLRQRRTLQQEHVTRCEREIRERLTQQRWETAKNCQELARELLPGLWEKHRAELLPRLAGELPSIPWTSIQVNAADVNLARELFPNVDVTANSKLAGGLLAKNRDIGLTIDAGLDTCLDRLLPELLPRVLKVIDDACQH